MAWRGAWLRRAALDLAVVLVPAVAVLWAEPPFSWSVPSALVACGLLPLRHIGPPLAVVGGLWGLAGGLGWPAALVALYALGRRGGRVSTTLPWLGLPLVAAVTPVLMTQALPWQSIVLTVAFVGLYTVAPASMGLLMATRERLTESLRELERARGEALAASQDAVRAQERARIGREIHDAVGHHATLIAVGAAAIAASTGEDETRRGAEQLRVLAKRALAEMRVALGLLDGREDAAGLTEIAALVAGSKAAGVDVELLNTGAPGEVGPAVGRAVYRVVQESLTNAARHAAGTAVSVELRWDPLELQVQVQNARPSRPSRWRREPLDGGGAGLTGLAERVASVGGQLSWGPTAAGGFAVRATFPFGGQPAPAPVAPPAHEEQLPAVR
jgi:signal transduction histidine kinase